MSFGPSSPVTGGAQTGLTSPTYTIVSDTPPVAHSEQVAVTALGGTQTGVRVHSVSSPFTLAMFRPATFKSIGVPNPSTGVITTIPRNVYKLITRKGVQPAANQPYVPMLVVTEISVPAGGDTYDAVNIRAAMSLHIGALWAQSAGIGDSLIDGVL